VSLVDQLGLSHPIVQAGMGGGIAGGRLAGAERTSRIAARRAPT
jgi:NAD(P)H-dependent flavin oxidoreductase YrpB (nitropropane dioxygenase family)